MAITTYAQLKTEVQNWINKTSISASADDFVTLAEAFLNNELRTNQMLALGTGTVSSNPTDLSSELTRYLRVKGLSINSGSRDIPLNYIPYDVYQAAYSATSSGTPEFYTLIGDNLYLDPAPSTSYTYSILYYQRLLPLASGVNWLLTNHPHIYLYASLAEAAIYAKDDQAAQGYVALRDRYMAALRRSDIRDRFTGTSRRISEMGAV